MLAEESLNEPVVFMFGRDECGYCREQSEYLKEEGLEYQHLNIATDEVAKTLYDQVTEKHGVSKVTPITVIGETVIVGFNGAETTGVTIKKAIETARTSDIRTIEDHLARAPKQEVVMNGGCSGIECSGGEQSQFVFDLPFLGVVDLQTSSLLIGGIMMLILGLILIINPSLLVL